uniref:Uncharacterized protein n=1 Tax=Compsopogon caeruleus TaxID=31354 RepID=A0A7S1XCR8_9RHOD|mmetsp:Transcript_13304/g.27025  ORF Transcript_13304/g.27025 Transcript_13304/m.27025 type:complete len:313 (+) Transcript_13304:205-1143(+)|eukprot:CAMPEP_0184689092 /NCGR_PEP_ID=MMETSP0312-20130426/30463_1 /TAXON_ID=31354 /ORGANISM="Compsopogon coeruleus, Strain SAG 36.94" /LENGTH=312 /DNA_ID=CAMNT_0027146399 /DNA_START=201 /DNA_END=1139 /DNA_ORIENTATION=+
MVLREGRIRRGWTGIDAAEGKVKLLNDCVGSEEEDGSWSGGSAESSPKVGGLRQSLTLTPGHKLRSSLREIIPVAGAAGGVGRESVPRLFAMPQLAISRELSDLAAMMAAFEKVAERPFRDAELELMDWFMGFQTFAAKMLDVEEVFLIPAARRMIGRKPLDTSEEYIADRLSSSSQILHTLRSRLTVLGQMYDDLFVFPIAKIFSVMNDSTKELDHLLQVYYRESRMTFSPLWTKMSFPEIHALERIMINDITRGPSGYLNLAILTSWMPKAALQEWRRKTLDSSKRPVLKRGELEIQKHRAPIVQRILSF